MSATSSNSSSCSSSSVTTIISITIKVPSISQVLNSVLEIYDGHVLLVGCPSFRH